MVIFYVILAVVVVAAAMTLAILHKLHWTAFAVAAVVALLLPLVVSAITLAIAKTDKQTFHEYWNGYETNAYQRDTACYRDGICVHTFDCDPYTVYETEYYTDSDGERQSRQVPVTKYHECPYSTQETSYYVDSTLKTFTIASNQMTGEEFRWGHPIPGGRVTEAPALWSEAKARVEAGTPGAVSLVNDYKNFIHASEQSILKSYSSIIEELKEKQLLPKPATGVQNHYAANKLHVIGDLGEVNAADLEHQLKQLNGAVGTELRGDLHVVLVDENLVKTSEVDYGNALLAYWQDAKTQGRDTLGKNAIVIVAAVKDYKASRSSTTETDSTATTPSIANGTPVIAWAQAFTGMPLGNESLLSQLELELPGVPVDENLFGAPTYDVANEKIVHSDGVVEDILWGPNKFERVSMEAKDEGDTGTGFGYLSDEWQPDAGVMTLVFVLSGIFSGLALAAGVFFSIRLREDGAPDFVGNLFTNH